MHIYNTDLEKKPDRYFHSLIHICKREVKTHGKKCSLSVTAYNLSCVLIESSNTSLCFGCWANHPHRLILILSLHPKFFWQEAMVNKIKETE